MSYSKNQKFGRRRYDHFCWADTKACKTLQTTGDIPISLRIAYRYVLPSAYLDFFVTLFAQLSRCHVDVHNELCLLKQDRCSLDVSDVKSILL